MLPNYQNIQEIDVLVATIVFLIERGVKPYQLSITQGNGIDYDSAMNQIFEVLISHNIQPVFFDNKGQHVIGVSETEWWQVECKGSGNVVPSSQRDNFDRALSSVVSYYEKETKRLPRQYEPYSTAQPYLGLAIPASPAYMKELKKRVRPPLRKRRNLWILLYEPESKSIRAVSPEDSY
jgi:hypothetical protein